MPPESGLDNGEPMPEFMRLQREFARHLRNPDQVPSPVAQEKRRLAIYEHAIFANVAGLMSDNYPRIKDALSEPQWNGLMRDYIVHHRARASAFIDVPREFLDYLSSERQQPKDREYLYELAHFDWLETLVGADQRQLDFTAIERDGDLLAGTPVANPVMVLETYRYPVHAINADYQPEQAPQRPTLIAAFRDPDKHYGFLDLNDASFELLQAVVNNRELSGEQLLLNLAAGMALAEPVSLLSPGRDILERMHARGAILGSRCDAS